MIEVLVKQDIQYLYNEIYDQNEELKILPYCFYDNIEPTHIRQFCVENGIYCLPTSELIDFLKNEIKGKKAIEIGAGHGAIGRELQIHATDSCMQLNSEIQILYKSVNQPIVKYGKNVEKYDADDAVYTFKPDIVIAAWVTHKYDPRQRYREGNQWGVREEKILKKVEKYIFIGNTSPHKFKPILDLPHETFESIMLVSRLFKRNGVKDLIWIWDGEKYK